MSEKQPLSITHPDLVKEWCFELNGELKPSNVTYGSDKKVWWKCDKGDDHFWEASISHRVHGKGCAICAGRKVVKSNCLATLHPELAKQWHPTKNGELTPNQVVSKSNRKVWWICGFNPLHVWQATINNRHKADCPYCQGISSSRIEIRVFSELTYVFDNVKHRIRKYGKELDIYLPKFQLGIEYDGRRWHLNNYEKDFLKTKFFHDKGINIIRIREKGLKKINNHDIIHKFGSSELDLIIKVLKTLRKIIQLPSDICEKIDDYITLYKLRNEKYTKFLVNWLPRPPKRSSLKYINPELSKEWHPTKNKHLKPSDVYSKAGIAVWWKCSKNPNHEWKNSVAKRMNGRGCPYCSGQQVHVSNCLATVNPDLAKEWHPTKNNDLTPYHFTSGSVQKVWWLCSRNSSHEWQATIDKRNRGRGCPICSHKYRKQPLIPTENLLINKSPKLAQEWHKDRNHDLTPSDVSYGSHKKVWWLCAKGHEWEARIDSRSRGSGCPYCRRKL